MNTYHETILTLIFVSTIHEITQARLYSGPLRNELYWKKKKVINFSVNNYIYIPGVLFIILSLPSSYFAKILKCALQSCIGACNCLNLRDPQLHTTNIVIIEFYRFPPLSSTLTFYKLSLIHVVLNLCNLN
jgi:hypothetical protein